MPPVAPADLVARSRGGDRAALAKVLSLIERGGEPAREVGRLTHPAGGHAHVIGITGAPGAGKSTLTSGLVGALRSEDLRVGVLAIDPSSPFSGGAILGDRVRMGDHALDPGVFIRSMATRGHLGGLSLATPEAMRALDAAGFDPVIVETVGVGQVEVEVAGEADTTIVVVNPGWGDAVQANKAGLMEIADIFVVNKADRPGVDTTVSDIGQMLDLSVVRDWRPPVVCTVSTTGEGVDELRRVVADHRAHLDATGELAVRRAARLRNEMHRILAERLLLQARALGSGDRFEALCEQVASRELDPWTATDTLLAGEG